MKSLTEMDKETVVSEVTDTFDQLISAINRLDAPAWAEHYSRDGFLSGIAGTDCCAERSAWVDLITSYFSMRERQCIKPIDVRVIPLESDLALLISEENADMLLKNGDHDTFKHVYTMVWKKEAQGWKILHSHESWVIDQHN